MIHTKKPKAPSPGTVERDKQRTVLGMLPEDGSKRRWSSLEKEAREKKMSLRTLRKNLDKLERARLVTREVDVSKRPPGVYYRRFAGIGYAVSSPEGGHTYDVKTLMENALEVLNKKINDLKKKDHKRARQKLGELIKFNINETFRYIIILFLRDLREQGPNRRLGEHNDMEEFNRWMDVIVNSRLEMLLQLCIWQFDVAESVIEEVKNYYIQKVIPRPV